MQRFIAKNLVSISMAFAGLMALALGLMLAWQSFTAHRAAQQIQAVQTVTASLFEATTLLARERGYVAATLNSADHALHVLEIARLRAQVDESWSRAETVLWQLVSRLPEQGSERAHMASLQASHALLLDARERADRALQAGQARTPGEAHAWFDTVSGAIAMVTGLRGALLSSVDMPGRLTWIAMSLQNSLWMSSELSGQLRGSLAAHAAANEAVPGPRLVRLAANRDLLRRLLENLTWVASLPETDPRLQASLQAAMVSLQSFDVDVGRMLKGAGSGLYPRDAFDWFHATSAVVDDISEVSETLDRVIQELFQHEADRLRLIVAGFLLFALVAGIFALLSLRRVQKNSDALFLQKELAETTLRSIGDAVLSTDRQGRIDYMNPVAEELTKWTLAEAKGRPSVEVFHLQSTPHASMVDPVGTCLREGRVVHLTSGHELIRRDGSRIAIEDSAAPIRNRDAEIVGVVVVFYNTDASQRPEHLLAYHSTHDPQTDLINRREFDRRLAELIGRAREFGERHVMAYIDLDRFKVVNDTCGHNAGDRLLSQATFLLRKSVRDTDTLARLGGDEFGLLLHNCTVDQALPVLQKVSDTIRSFGFSAEGQSFDITLSIGAVAIDADSSTAVNLMGAADAACYAAKEKGRNRIQIYSADDTELSRRKGESRWVAELGDALKEDRLELFCQRIDPLLQPGRTNRVELLVRLRTREGVLVPPMTFIPAAERYNLMTEVDRWVIRHACSMIASQQGLPESLVFHINLSGQSLSDATFPDFVRTVARETGILPRQLCFEVTETTAVASLHTAHHLMKTLRAEEFTFALDDFGTGLSSFAYLRSLEVDHIKIDGAFVRNMLDDELDQVMIRSVVAIARVLGITVCAEFAENPEVVAKLRRMGVDYAQGYAAGYPLSLQDYFAAFADGHDGD